jgi:hypothetical protein
MKQFVSATPPDWIEVVVTWDWIMEVYKGSPNDMYAWCDRYSSKGAYHVHGWESTEGFAFRFEKKSDAVVFALHWS